MQVPPESSSRNRSGLPFGIVSAIAFGLSPLFIRNLYRDGFDVNGVLFFRFLPAVIVLGAVSLCRRKDLRLTGKEFLQCLISGAFFCGTSILLFRSYLEIDVGIGATLFFIYPVFVVLTSVCFFRERLSVSGWLALFIAFAGVALLSLSHVGSSCSVHGILLALLSAFCYAGYQVWTARSGTGKMPADKLTFYLVLFNLLFYFGQIGCGLELSGNFTMSAWLNIAGISMISALLAMACSAIALQRSGATVTAVLGSLEPLTAVVLSVAVFHEGITVQKFCGTAMIIAAVLCIIVRKPRKR